MNGAARNGPAGDRVTQRSGAARSRQILVQDARIGDRSVDVRIVRGVVAEIGALGRESADFVVPARGGEVIAGLHDHHIHVLAAAARRESLSLRGLRGDLDSALEAIRSAAARVPEGEWIRVVDYREEAAADGSERRVPTLDRSVLDRAAPANPVRVQDATGGLWVLNSCALASVPADLIAARAPTDAEIGPCGDSNGRFHRMDAELAEVWPESVNSIRSVGDDLLRRGITGLTDATPTTDPARMRAVTDANASGDLPQDVELLADRKIVLSDHDLPDVDRLSARIAAVHATGRSVAIHTVTLESGFLACHALATVGARRGDRLEHAAVTSPELIRMIADLDLTIVTQPGFVADRGEMYRRVLDLSERDGIYRYRSLLDAGVRIAPSSDHPFGPIDPWASIRAAVGRRTEEGAPLAAHEAVEPSIVLRGYQSPLRDPGVRRMQGRHDGGGRTDERLVDPREAQPHVGGGVVVGATADLCVLRAPLHEVFADLCDTDSPADSMPAAHVPSPVAATLIDANVWSFGP